MSKWPFHTITDFQELEDGVVGSQPATILMLDFREGWLMRLIGLNSDRSAAIRGEAAEGCAKDLVGDLPLTLQT